MNFILERISRIPHIFENYNNLRGGRILKMFHKKKYLRKQLQQNKKDLQLKRKSLDNNNRKESNTAFSNKAKKK